MPEKARIPIEKKKFVEQFENHPVLGEIGKKLEKHKKKLPTIKNIFHLERRLRGTEWRQTLTLAGLVALAIAEDEKLPQDKKIKSIWRIVSDIESSVYGRHDPRQVIKWHPKGFIIPDTKRYAFSRFWGNTVLNQVVPEYEKLPDREDIAHQIKPDDFKTIAEEFRKRFPNEEVSDEEMNYINIYAEAVHKIAKNFQGASRTRAIAVRERDIESAREIREEAYKKIFDIFDKIDRLEEKIASEYEDLRNRPDVDKKELEKMKKILNMVRAHRMLVEEATSNLRHFYWGLGAIYMYNEKNDQMYTVSHERRFLRKLRGRMWAPHPRYQIPVTPEQKEYIKEGKHLRTIQDEIYREAQYEYRYKSKHGSGKKSAQQVAPLDDVRLLYRIYRMYAMQE